MIQKHTTNLKSEVPLDKKRILSYFYIQYVLVLVSKSYVMHHVTNRALKIEAV